MVRMMPETVRKGEFRRKALTPLADGRSRWEFPTTFLMDHPAGFWLSIAVPRLEEKVSRSSWETFLAPNRRTTAGGDETSTITGDNHERIPDSSYPAGQPLTEIEQRTCRNHRPKSATGGEFLCWDFSCHAGCRSTAGNCPRGKHEIIKATGLHPLIQMQLVRRGCQLTGEKIQPRDAGGHVQALRLQLVSKDLDIPLHLSGGKEEGKGRMSS